MEKDKQINYGCYTIVFIIYIATYLINSSNLNLIIEKTIRKYACYLVLKTMLPIHFIIVGILN